MRAPSLQGPYYIVCYILGFGMTGCDIRIRERTGLVYDQNLVEPGHLVKLELASKLSFY